MSAKRKLAAILSADVAGYSRLMADDEPATLTSLNESRGLFKEKIESCDGRLIDTAGDSVLAEFPSAVEAVRCACEIQLELEQRNAGVPEHRRMQFRAGINLGDVLEEGGSLYGDGVNVAARLQQLSEPGGLCVSGTVYDQVEGKVPLAFTFTGEQSVKNIPKPVRTYRVNWTVARKSFPRRGFAASRTYLLVGLGVLAIIAIGLGAIFWTGNRDTAGTVASDPVLNVSSGPGVAVLPLTNMSGDPEQEYFADGITEEIISGLSRFPNLRVIARNSTFQYKGKSKDVREIGREIHANYVVEGSVQKAGDSVRVTVQLLDATTGAHVWAETYERLLDPKHLFAVQDEITSQVVARIGDVHGVVNLADVAKTRTKGDASLDDYECILRTYEYQRFLARDKHAVVKACLARTVERNPGYADAWANLAYTYADQYWTDYPGPPDPLEHAYAAARKAVELDPNNQLAHFALANVYFFRKQPDRFFPEAEKALALNPNNTDVLAATGVRFAYAGKWERGVGLMRKAMSLNPSHPGWYWLPIVYYHYSNRDYDKALDAALRVDMPNYFPTHIALAVCYAQLGRQQEANVALQELRKLKPDFEGSPTHYLDKWRTPEDTQHILEGLYKAGMARIASSAWRPNGDAEHPVPAERQQPPSAPVAAR